MRSGASSVRSGAANRSRHRGTAFPRGRWPRRSGACPRPAAAASRTPALSPRSACAVDVAFVVGTCCTPQRRSTSGTKVQCRLMSARQRRLRDMQALRRQGETAEGAREVEGFLSVMIAVQRTSTRTGSSGGTKPSCGVGGRALAGSFIGVNLRGTWRNCESGGEIGLHEASITAMDLGLNGFPRSLT
jgi:hypothetical protein